MLYISQIPILNNIINFFNIKEVFTNSEQDDLELTMVNLMDHFIESDPLRYSSPNFHSTLKHYVYNFNIYMMKIFLKKKLIKYTIKLMKYILKDIIRLDHMILLLLE